MPQKINANKSKKKKKRIHMTKNWTENQGEHKKRVTNSIGDDWIRSIFCEATNKLSI